MADERQYDWASLGIDVTKPSIARTYDVVLRGKDNFEVDRAFVDQIAKIVPEIYDVAAYNRQILGRGVRYLAGESARQCGPCMFGLPAIADDLGYLAAGRRHQAQAALHQLRRRLDIISGRGACAHPDGAVRLASSALRVFSHDVAAHAAGRPCPYAAGPAHLTVPGAGSPGVEGWR